MGRVLGLGAFCFGILVWGEALHVQGGLRQEGAMAFAGAPRATNNHTVAWVHIPTCGTSFGTTLAHYANSDLPENAHINNALFEGHIPNAPPCKFWHTRSYSHDFFGRVWLGKSQGDA